MTRDVGKINENQPVKTGGAVIGGAFPTTYFNEQTHLKRNQLDESHDVNKHDETPDSQPFFNQNVTNSLIIIKVSPGHLQGVQIENGNGNKAYLQVFDSTGNVNLGVTKPRLSFFIPANGAYDNVFPNDAKVEFASGICIAATNTSNGSAAPADSSGVMVNLIYS